jgi:hypothetical protein
VIAAGSVGKKKFKKKKVEHSLEEVKEVGKKRLKIEDLSA